MILPIVRRELQVRARSRATAWLRVGAAVISVALAAVTIFAVMGATRPGELGRVLFLMLAWMGFLFCLCEGPRLASDSISEEKRKGTLGLLFLTDLRGYDVILGKLAAVGLGSFYTLLATFPALALPLLLGGVTAGEFWRMILALTTTMLLSFTVSIWSSVLCFRPLQGLFTTSITLALVLFMPLIFSSGFHWELVRFSPWFAFRGSLDQSYRAAPGIFWSSVLQSWSLAILLLASAAWSLRRRWQDTPNSRPSSAWFRRLSELVRPPAWLVQKNPVHWQATRDARAGLASRGMALVVLAGGMAIMVVWPSTGPVPKGLFLGIAIGIGLLHFILCVWIAAAACQLSWRERDTGALELLLCTPFPVVSIVDGYSRALHWIFAWPILTILVVEGFLVTYACVAGLGSVPWFVLAVALLLGGVIAVTEYYALGWFGLWCGLTSRKPGGAITKTLLLVLILPLFALLGCAFLWVGFSIVKNLVFVTFSRNRLFEELRRKVSEPLPIPGTRKPRPDRGRLPEVLPTGPPNG